MSRIRRRQFLFAAGALLAAPFGADAQPAAKVHRIGWLSAASPTSSLEFEALQHGLRRLGYVEGRNLAFEARWAEGNSAALPALARSLVERKVDVICGAGTQASLAAKQATTTIPIVTVVAFPVQSGLVASLARPGGNVTGVAFVGEEYGKRLELLREVSPRLARVALFYNDQNPASILAMKETQRWAQQLRMTLEPQGVHDRESVDKALAAMAKNLPGALMTTADPIVTSLRREIAAFAARHRLLSMHPDYAVVEAGGLMYYGTSASVMWGQAATYVQRILQGTKPADLPIEQPMKFDLAVNLKTAKTLGITIPRSVLMRADRVIE